MATATTALMKSWTRDWTYPVIKRELISNRTWYQDDKWPERLWNEYL